MSPRPRKPRRCTCPLRAAGRRVFKPSGVPLGRLERVVLGHDELESLVLCDRDGLTQQQAGARMGVSRGTVQRLLAAARRKVAHTLATDAALVLEGEDGAPAASERHAPGGGGGSFWLTVGQQRLEATWHGPGPGRAPTLVFLHEGLGCVGLWRDFPARLAAATGWGALVYSRLGYGHSDPCPLPRPLDYMEVEGREVLPEVLAAAGVRDCVLVGHSDGGSIALVYAGSNPLPGLRGVITEAAHLFCEDLSVASIAAARESFRHGDLRARLARHHGSNVDCAFWGWNGAWLDPDFRSWNIEECLPGIRVPVLALQGRDDEYGTAAQLEAIGRGVGPAATTRLLPDCGHAPHRDQPQAALEAMADFIRSLPEQPC